MKMSRRWRNQPGRELPLHQRAEHLMDGLLDERSLKVGMPRCECRRQSWEPREELASRRLPAGVSAVRRREAIPRAPQQLALVCSQRFLTQSPNASVLIYRSLRLRPCASRPGRLRACSPARQCGASTPRQSRLSPPHLHHDSPGKHRTFTNVAVSSPSCCLVWVGLFIGAMFRLRLPSASAPRRRPLACS